MATSTYTSFNLTPDDPGGDSTTQDINTNIGTGLEGTDRYSKAGFTGTYMYPLSEEIDGFYTPMMHFKFYNAKGEDITSSPTIQVRVPNNFNVTNLSDYSRTENIFGSGPIADIYAGALAGTKPQVDKNTTMEDIAQMGVAASEAFGYSVRKSLANVQGFLASGGLNALSQYEFLQRAAVNPYAQLLYKGPQFRRYQIPISIKPRNSSESQNALNIIKIFKLASSPTVQNRKINIPSLGSSTEAKTGVLQSFVFGYPHLTQFDIKFKTGYGSNAGVTSKDIFKSKLCAIESVSVDYGGQKMAFFEDGVPTDITLTISLSEVSVRTLGDARLDAAVGRTIL